MKRFTGHWHEDDSMKGSGYRSLSFDDTLDSTLAKAGRKCGMGMEQLVIALSSARNRIMFVNPGAVRVINVTLLTALPDSIYEKGEEK